MQIIHANKPPWSHICSLQFTYKDYPHVKWGTGTFIGNRVILTAGHNVYNPELHWPERCVVIPGHSKPSGGEYGRYVTDRMRTVEPWIEEESRKPLSERLISQYDYGAVFLDEPIGEIVGKMPFTAADPELLLNLPVHTAGYPVDEPIGTLWWQYGTIREVTTARLFYDILTRKGQSGGPVFDFDPETKQRAMVGIHTSFLPLMGGRGSGVRITPQIEHKLRKWVREHS